MPRKGNLPILFFLFKVVLAIFDLPFFIMNFRHNLLNSVENSVGILIGIKLNLWENLESIDFFYPVESFAPEDGVILYLSRFMSFISPSTRL